MVRLSTGDRSSRCRTRAIVAPASRQLTKLTILVGTGVLQVELCGQLDRSNAPELVEAVDFGLRAKMHVLVDCADLTFIDAEGTRALLRAYGSSGVEITNLHGFPLRVIDLLRSSDRTAAADLFWRSP